MIPKVIHYCWFGRNPLPPLAVSCIKSWRKYCPDYKIKEWNEKNFDINSNKYVKQAYEAKKYAFVSDYARLLALYTCGGIYLDTDVELIKPLDIFLAHNAFLGFETNALISTGIMGSEKECLFIAEFLEHYDDRSFLKKDNTYDMTTNVTVITDLSKKHGLKTNNKEQELTNNVHLYPSDYFCAKCYETGTIKLTDNTYAIHHFAASWLS